jgi:tetratricopeptide (TPR) repeat protein
LPLYINNRLTRTVLAAMAAVLMLAAAAQADRILTQKRIGINGEITGLAADGLVITDADGNKKSVALGDIARIKSDKFPDLEKAEDDYAKGVAGDAKSLASAERLYRGMMAPGAPQWLRVLVQSRMFKLYADSGRSVEALDAFLELARAQPRLAVGLKLPAPAEEAHEANQKMLAKVGEALKTAGAQPYASELRNLQVALLMYEGKPEEVLQLLPPLLKSPDEKTRLNAILKQVELLIASGHADEASRVLEANAAALEPSHPDDVLFWRGRLLKEKGKNMEAALEFMRVAILYPAVDKNRTAEALHMAGQAMEAARAPKDEVRKVYNEAVAKYAGTAGAERAKRELVRLGA